MYSNKFRFVFDSRIDGRIKDSEIFCWYKHPAIDIHAVVDSTPIPVGMSTFWTSNGNKQKFQLLFIQHLLENA